MGLWRGGLKNKCPIISLSPSLGTYKNKKTNTNKKYHWKRGGCYVQGGGRGGGINKGGG